MSFRLESSPRAPAATNPQIQALSQSARPSAPQAAPEHFRHVLEGLGPRLDTGEALIGRALHGNLGTLEAPQLIAVQAGIYRYTEALDFTGKLLDRATQSVRTVLQPGAH